MTTNPQKNYDRELTDRLIEMAEKSISAQETSVIRITNNEAKIAELMKHVVGNGQPGLNEYVRNLNREIQTLYELLDNNRKQYEDILNKVREENEKLRKDNEDLREKSKTLQSRVSAAIWVIGALAFTFAGKILIEWARIGGFI